MARTLNKLTDSAVRSASLDGAKQRKLADGGGLTLIVKPSSKAWWFRYRFAGKEKTYSLGLYPEVSLKAARAQREECRRLLEDGIDPVSHRRSGRSELHVKGANTFKSVAEEWDQAVYQHKVQPTTREKNIRRLEMYVFPLLGRHPIADIKPPEVLEVLRRIQAKGHVDNAHRLKSLMSQVFRYAVSTGRAERDVTVDLRGVLPPAKTKHYAAVVTPEDIAPLLRAIESYRGTPTVCAALKLAPMLFLRPGNLRRMRWADIDWENKQWTTERTKNGEPLIVPLPRQALDILNELEALNGRREWVFPSHHGRGQPMSENTINGALVRLGYKDEMTAHGFRAMAKTVLTERLGFRTEIIEMQMAHRVRDVHGRAYNRTTWLPERREMMQAWANYLTGLLQGDFRCEK